MPRAEDAKDATEDKGKDKACGLRL